MSSYERVSDTETVNVSADSTTQSGRFEVGDKDVATVILVGDANSSDVTVDYKACAESGANLGDLQRARQTGNNFTRTNLDLTANSNNKIVLEDVPVAGLNQLAIDLTENTGGSAIDVDVKVATKEIE